MVGKCLAVKGSGRRMLRSVARAITGLLSADRVKPESLCSRWRGSAGSRQPQEAWTSTSPGSLHRHGGSRRRPCGNPAAPDSAQPASAPEQDWPAPSTGDRPVQRGRARRRRPTGCGSEACSGCLAGRARRGGKFGRRLPVSWREFVHELVLLRIRAGRQPDPGVAATRTEAFPSSTIGDRRPDPLTAIGDVLDRLDQMIGSAGLRAVRPRS